MGGTPGQDRLEYVDERYTQAAVTREMTNENGRVGNTLTTSEGPPNLQIFFWYIKTIRLCNA